MNYVHFVSNKRSMDLGVLLNGTKYYGVLSLGCDGSSC